MFAAILNLSSPLLFALFVKGLSFIRPIPDSKLMKTCRKLHNIFLSLLSFAMLLGITVATYQENKFSSAWSLICHSYNQNSLAYWSTQAFMYSKYLEWGDTLFLQLSGKPISWLQYTHHMTTAILCYLNFYRIVPAYIYIFMGTNCFVHTPMYWYFAYPKGVLYPVRKGITIIQIVQHIMCVCTSIFGLLNRNTCPQEYIGNVSGFMLYMMYLAFFVAFYIKKYADKRNKNK
jgi:elongation of very long chain fatty acids protein 6